MYKKLELFTHEIRLLLERNYQTIYNIFKKGAVTQVYKQTQNGNDCIHESKLYFADFYYDVYE